MPKPKSRTNEVVPLLENERRQRRKFTAEQKNRILDQADACKRGELGELLRREGIYASQLTSWRAQREQNGLAGLAGSRPGPKPSKDSKDRLIEKLERENARLQKELRISRGLIDLQVKAHEILGIALPRIEDETEGDSSHSFKSQKKGSR